MTGQKFVLTVLAACLILAGCPSIEATLSWIFNVPPRSLQPLPEICGLQVIVGNRTYNSSILYELPPNVGPIEYRLLEDQPLEHLHHLESGVSPGSEVPGSFGQWLVRIGNNTAGALISPRHVITLAPCLTQYTSWFSGYYSFAVMIADKVIQVSDVTVQDAADDNFPLALLTLAPHNLTRVSPPVCAGSYRAGLVARAITWSDTEDIPQEHTVTVYPSWHCTSYQEGFRGDQMLCGSPGPMMCGSPLAQIEDNRWRLVGLGNGEVGEVATYISLAKARRWLKQVFLD